MPSPRDISPMRRIERPPASSPKVRLAMQAIPKRDSTIEIELRRILYRLGLRYRVDAKPLSFVNRKADVVFSRARVAVFVDGCFWHGCPLHSHIPKTNSAFWA